MSGRDRGRTRDMEAADWMDAYSEAAAAGSVEEAARILRAGAPNVDAETYNRASNADSIGEAARIIQDSSRRSNSGGGVRQRSGTPGGSTSEGVRQRQQSPRGGDSSGGVRQRSGLPSDGRSGGVRRSPQPRPFGSGSGVGAEIAAVLTDGSGMATTAAGAAAGIALAWGLSQG